MLPEPVELPRIIRGHRGSTLNNNTAIWADARDENGGSHFYRIEIIQPAQTSNDISTVVAAQDLHFQQGPLLEAGHNGISDEALIAIVIDRLEGFQTGPFKSRYNALAITKLEEALMWLQKRTADRQERGVEGTHKV